MKFWIVIFAVSALNLTACHGEFSHEEDRDSDKDTESTDNENKNDTASADGTALEGLPEDCENGERMCHNTTIVACLFNSWQLIGDCATGGLALGDTAGLTAGMVCVEVDGEPTCRPPQMDTDSLVNWGSDSFVLPETDSAVNPDSDTDIDTDTDTDTDTGTGTGTDTGTDADTGTDTGVDSTTDSSVDSGTDTSESMYNTPDSPCYDAESTDDTPGCYTWAGWGDGPCAEKVSACEADSGCVDLDECITNVDVFGGGDFLRNQCFSVYGGGEAETLYWDYVQCIFCDACSVACSDYAASKQCATYIPQ